MSDLLNKASLVMVPSGYKEDTVYSVVPSDGSGDLSFTRASNGTRVNSAGLVEVCPWNLTNYSEDFSNGYWAKNNSPVMAYNVATAPNGTMTADSIQSNTASVYQSVSAPTQSVAPNSTVTLSIYIKKETSKTYFTGSYLYFTGGTAKLTYVLFDEVNGTINIVAPDQVSMVTSVESVGDWWRFIMTGTDTGGNTNLDYSFYGTLSQNGTTLDTGIGSARTIWGAQLNIGSTAKPYFPTTDRLNVPRLTYQNGGGGCPSLLLEKQSTNIAYPSQAISGYTKSSDVTLTDNNAISPDGTQNATYYFCNTTTTNGYLLPSFSGTSGVQYAVSFYAKAKELSLIYIKNVNDTGGQGIFNLSNGTYTILSGIDSMSIVDVGNGWYRCTAISTSSTTNISFIPIIKGSANQGVYIWGVQIEQSSYPTSYIPTTSSSATRVADVMNVNLPNTNMTFTAYLELEEAPIATTAGDWFSIESNVSALGRAYGYANQFGFADAYSLGAVGGTKMVWKQESGTTAKIFKGGALVGTSTTGTYSDAFNRLNVYGSNLDKPVKIKQFVFFDNALTDAECIQLTA